MSKPNTSAQASKAQAQTDNVQLVKAPKVASYDISRSDETISLATDLAKFIRENKLTHNVQGKEYVNVEGWQYAGSRLGIVPIVAHVTDMSHDGEIKYSSSVTLFDMRSQQTVGAGFAVCSNKENGKKFYAEYAIASMAQTRAIGKAYRNLLAWIIRAAGYEPTPAEEMDYQTIPNAPAHTTPASPAQASAPMAAPAAAAPAAAGNDNLPTSNEFSQVDPAKRATAEKAAATAPGEVVAASKMEDVRYATAKQKEEIIRLLNNPVITRAEKTKMMLNINKLDDNRAQQSIDKLRQAIKEREKEQQVAA